MSERHDKEIYFYEKFAHKIKHVALPKIYASRLTHNIKGIHNGCILMEDLSKNSVMEDILNGLNKAQVNFKILKINQLKKICIIIFFAFNI